MRPITAPGPRARRILLVAALASLPSSAPARPPSALDGDTAWVHLLRGDPEHTVAVATQVLARDPEEARAAACLAEGLRALGREPEALAYFRGRERRTPRSGSAVIGLGKIENLRRHFTQADRLFDVALARFVARRDSLGEMVARLEKGGNLRDAGRPDQAAPHLEAALRLAEALHRPLAVIQAHYGLGYARIHVGRNAEAEVHVRRSLEGARRLDLPLWIGDAEYLLSVLRWFEMDLDRTLQHQTNACAAYERARNPLRLASCLRNMAATYGSRGELPLAIQKLRRAQDLAAKAGDRREASICLEHLGSMHDRLGDEALALEQWQQAVRLGGDLWPQEWLGGTLGNIARAQARRGRYDQALVSFERALRVLDEARSQRDRAEVLRNMGECLRQSGRPKRALVRLQRALQIARQWDMPLFAGQALTEMGLCHLALGKLPEARAAFAEAERLVRGRGFYEIDLKLRGGQARVARAAGDTPGALRALEEALEIAEGVRRRSRSATAIQEGVFGRSAHLYEQTVDLLHAMHLQQPEAGLDRKAFDVAQRAKARSFLDLLTEADLDLRLRADPDFRRRERDILSRIAARVAEEAKRVAEPARFPVREGPHDEGLRIQDKIEGLEEQLAILESEIRVADPRYAELRYPRPSGLEYVQREILGPDDLLLEFLLGEEASYLWAVTRDSFRFLRLPARDSVEAQVRALIPMLQDYNLLGEDPRYFVAPARALFETLLAPAVPELRRARHLIVAPDGALHYLPFETLMPRDPGNAASWDALPYLVRSYDVSYTPSVSVLARLAGARSGRSRRELLLVGDPAWPADAEGSVFVRAAMGDRPPARAAMDAEIRALEGLYRQDQRLVLSGPRATLAGVRKAGVETPCRLVHFATHGVFNERRPAYSGLILAPDPKGGDDGFLTVGEVFGLELPCDQVVLSACSSALGEQMTGEGVVGLTRAFLYAGARSVVAALWEVSGAATSRFMGEYYTALRSGSGRARALAQAKRSLIRGQAASQLPPAPHPGSQPTSTPAGPVSGAPRISLAHPYFWAGFLLTGDPR